MQSRLLSPLAHANKALRQNVEVSVELILWSSINSINPDSEKSTSSNQTHPSNYRAWAIKRVRLWVF